ncbi:hypothetical protein AB0H63_15585 [Micromonospora echinospora]
MPFSIERLPIEPLDQHAAPDIYPADALRETRRPGHHRPGR